MTRLRAVDDPAAQRPSATLHHRRNLRFSYSSSLIGRPVTHAAVGRRCTNVARCPPAGSSTSGEHSSVVRTPSRGRREVAHSCWLSERLSAKVRVDESFPCRGRPAAIHLTMDPVSKRNTIAFRIGIQVIWGFTLQPKDRPIWWAARRASRSASQARAIDRQALKVGRPRSEIQ